MFKDLYTVTRVIIFFVDVEELSGMVKEIRTRISMLSAKLVKQLKRRDKNAYKLQKNFDILTAILQAVSQKRSKSISFSLFNGIYCVSYLKLVSWCFCELVNFGRRDLCVFEQE